jgi:PII-like signaling protein
MSLLGEQVLLRIYLQSADRPPHVPTYERIVIAAKKEGLAGATVLQGILGAGYHGIITPSRWAIAQHEPIILEIVDNADKIVRFIQDPLDQIMIGGMATLERATVMMYRPRTEPKPPSLHLAGALKPLSTLPQIQPGPHMTIQDNGVLLRIFIGESDKFQNKPLHEMIVQKTRELGLAGATVLRGTQGFGARSVVHRAGLLIMSTDLPILVEIVDTEDKIKLLLPHLETMVAEGMITMEYVQILMYRHEPPTPKTS